MSLSQIAVLLTQAAEERTASPPSTRGSWAAARSASCS